jgi:glucan phosphoethanolaminetransferase (alkaline phosphatase superfamily)
MYPTLEIFDITIHIFGVTLACTWLLFFVLLHHYAQKKGIIRPIFSEIVGFTISMFFFARIFHIFGDWLEEKFILMELTEGNILLFFKLFFTPQNYYFSLIGAVVGFLLVFFYKTHHTKEERDRYIDVIMHAFLFSALLGYLGALFGGQVYGIPYNGPLSITYTHSDSIVKDVSGLFPLA